MVPEAVTENWHWPRRAYISSFTSNGPTVVFVLRPMREVEVGVGGVGVPGVETGLFTLLLILRASASPLALSGPHA